MSSGKTNGIETYQDHTMTEVPKDFFFDGLPLAASIFIKMKPESYLLIGKKGDKASFSSLHAFSHQTAKVFVKTFEHPEFISSMTQLTNKLLLSDKIPDLVKIKFLGNLISDALEEITKLGVVSAAKLQKVAHMFDQLTQNLKSFSTALDLLQSLPENEAKHAMATCLMSLLLCDELSITQPLTREKISMGALLHDVGLRYIPKEILSKPKHLWSNADMELYQSHPIKGVEVLRQVKDITTDILLIVAEHHENAQGSGYPKRIRDVKISPMAKIVGLADYFTDLITTAFEEERAYTPDEAILYIEEVLGQPFHKQTYLALKNLINKKALSDKMSS